MTDEEILEVFKHPRPNGWFKDEEIEAARMALEQAIALQKSAPNNPSQLLKDLDGAISALIELKRVIGAAVLAAGT